MATFEESRMQFGSAKKIFAHSEPLIGGWLSIPCLCTAKIMAAKGYDMIGIDVRSGTEVQVVVGMIQAVRASGSVPLIRLSHFDPDIISPMITAGIEGFIAPNIGTTEQAANFVWHVRRAAATFRGFQSDSPICFVAVNPTTPLGTVELVARTPGLDGLYAEMIDDTLSPVDERRLDRSRDAKRKTVEFTKHFLKTCRASGIKSALHCATVADAVRYIKQGFGMVVVASDARMLAAAAFSDLEEAKRILEMQKLFRESIYFPSY